ncbi:hypothetical protein EYF80_044417 [Liparis tanakae]|uniref:Uncharacterized protein n=1 Tax=Liparis tanakae TaxID=230148 RepID=A0A4Z2FVY8_9TELE|nr:hypothetical protein EYF80_044417 [Liparis tanakae]
MPSPVGFTPNTHPKAKTSDCLQKGSLSSSVSGDSCWMISGARRPLKQRDDQVCAGEVQQLQDETWAYRQRAALDELSSPPSPCVTPEALNPTEPQVTGSRAPGADTSCIFIPDVDPDSSCTSGSLSLLRLPACSGRRVS